MNTPLRLGAAVEAFAVARRQAHIAETTIAQEQRVLSQFVRATGQHTWMRQVGLDDFRRFFYGDGDYTGISDRVTGTTFNGYRMRVVAFEEWARQEGHITEIPKRSRDGSYCALISTAPGEENDYRRLTEEEYFGLLDRAGAYDPRDRAMMATGMIVASRGSEVSRMQLGHVSPDLSELQVLITKSKNVHKKWRTVSLAPALRDELAVWLDFYAGACRTTVTELLKHEDYHLFPNRHVATTFGAEFSITYRPTQPVARPYEVVQMHLHRMGITDPRLGFHTLRRSGARLLYEHLKKMGFKDPLRLVQVHLNHKDRDTTLRYIGLAPDLEELNKGLATGDFLLPPRSDGKVVQFRARRKA